MLGYQSPVIPPKYSAEVKSFARRGNMVCTYELMGRTACEIIDRFERLWLAEDERGYEAHLPSAVYFLAEAEAGEVA